jgi:hypothetical protein
MLHRRKPSDPSKRKPIDSRIIGKWVIQEPVRVWRDSADFADRSIVFTAGGKFMYSGTGTCYEDLGQSKKGDKRTRSFSGPFWFLEDGKIEFINGDGDALVMGIDWITDNEIVLVENGEGGTRNRYMESHLKGTLARNSTAITRAESSAPPNTPAEVDAPPSTRARKPADGSPEKRPENPVTPATGPRNEKSEPELTRPIPPKPEETSVSAQLANELVQASPVDQGALVRKLQETKGVENTEALAFSIPRLEGAIKNRAREALTDRLARLQAGSVMNYLEDEDAEIRQAAALACAAKKLMGAVLKLIALLRDRETSVGRAAHSALKELTGHNPGASPAAWEAWWKQHGKE